MSAIILNELYLGNVLNANRLDWLNQKNIRTIICVASKEDVRIKPEIHSSKTVYQFEIYDNENQELDFNKIIQLIEKNMQRGAVLVNCAAGVSRSATFVIAYLMKTKHISLEEAYQIVKRARPKIAPNQSFLDQLMKFEKKIIG